MEGLVRWSSDSLLVSRYFAGADDTTDIAYILCSNYVRTTC